MSKCPRTISARPASPSAKVDSRAGRLRSRLARRLSRQTCVQLDLVRDLVLELVLVDAKVTPLHHEVRAQYQEIAVELREPVLETVLEKRELRGHGHLL